jgi:hypothetical protein
MFARVVNRSVFRPSVRHMGTYKTSTGLVGLEVDPQGRENLIAVADKILNSITVSESILDSYWRCFGIIC